MIYEKNKLVIIGAGMVGSAVLNTALSLNLLSEIVLVDMNMEKAEGEALDAGHTTSFAYSPNVKVRSGDYSECADAQIIVMTAGPSLKKGDVMDRTELARTNEKVVKSVMESIIRYTRDAIIIMVTNPLDVATYYAQNGFGYPSEKIIGTGTLLDTARFRKIIATKYSVDTKNVHGYILGEHGSTAFAAWSLVNIAGIPLDKLDEAFASKEPINRDATVDEVINSGFRILELKGYTSSGIAMSVGRLIKAIILNEQSILPVSTTLTGEYGIDRVALSIPCVVSSVGIERKIVIPLDENETVLLKNSAQRLDEVLIETGIKTNP